MHNGAKSLCRPSSSQPKPLNIQSTVVQFSQSPPPPLGFSSHSDCFLLDSKNCKYSEYYLLPSFVYDQRELTFLPFDNINSTQIYSCADVQTSKL